MKMDMYHGFKFSTLTRSTGNVQGKIERAFEKHGLKLFVHKGALENEVIRVEFWCTLGSGPHVVVGL
jgi:hypothetical protein